MKKLKLLCAMLLSFTLVACGGGNEQINAKGQNSIDGYMNYEILYSRITNKIEPAILDGYYTYYKAKSTSNTLVDLAMKVENTSDKELALKDLKGVFNIADQDYAAINVIEKDGATVSTSGTIASKEAKVIHMYTEVDLKTDFTQDIKFTLTANEKDYELTYKINDLQKAKDYQKAGYVLKDDKAEIKLDKITFADKLNPSKPASYYRYYKATSGKTFVALKITVKNIGKADLSSSKLIGAKVYADSKEYAGGLIIEDSNQANLTQSTTIKPGKTHTAYLVAEIPTSDKDKGIAVEMSVYYAGQEVYIKK